MRDVVGRKCAMGDEERIYRAFAGELQQWSRTDRTPATGNQDIRYYLELQRERLRRRGLRMEYRFQLRGEHLDNINRLLQPYDPNFSYEHFSSRIVNLLKMMIYTDDVGNTPVYDGQGGIPDFSNIVESVYQGSMGLNKGWVQDGYCYLDLDVYMSDIYDGKVMYRRNDMFRMVVCKTIKKGADLGFSIKKVQCAGCGGSFDATRKRICPYCGNSYHLREDDWVVLSIRKK